MKTGKMYLCALTVAVALVTAGSANALIDPDDSFCEWYQLVYDNPIWDMLPEEFQVLVEYLDPDVADTNGDSWVDLVAEIWNIAGNGMLDCSIELRLVEEVLKDVDFSLPNGLTYDLVNNAWDANHAQFALDVGTYWGLLAALAPGLQEILKGMMILGDGEVDYSDPYYITCSGSAGFVAAIMFIIRDEIDNGEIDLDDYARLPEYFASDGDADGDGCLNYEEFEAYGSDPDIYAANALDPEVFPPGCGFVRPSDGFEAIGPEGGPFVPPSKTYTLTNSDVSALNWTAAGTEAWLDVAPAGGTLNPGDSVGVVMSFNATANGLPQGTHTDTVTITNSLMAEPATRDVTLTVIDPLDVTPEDDYQCWGSQGGPFAPASKTYTLANLGTGSFDWSAEASEDWVDIAPNTGTLGSGGSAPAVVGLNANANALPEGAHTATVTFTNLTSAAEVTRDVLLSIGNAPPGAFYWFPMDIDPGWSTEGQWEFGIPLGGGSYNGDPTSGYTGINVYGYNLAGDYANGIPSYRLTTEVLDCTGYEDVTLDFWRWLGVESSSYDHATIEVSNDGSSWTTVWDHSGSAISDSAWVQCTYDISATADNQPTVYLRWTMGPTDSSVTYPGWNIDDVALLGELMDDLRVAPAESFTASGPESGPFTPPSKSYTLTNEGPGTLEWTATKLGNWLDIAPNTGTLGASDSVVVAVAFNANAEGLDQGVHNDTVTFTNLSSSVEQTRAVALTVTEPLDVAPAENFMAHGHPGGPFTPDSKTYTLTNTGNAPIDWSATNVEDWLDIAPNSGTLSGSASVAVGVSINANAAALGVGVYTDTLTFTNDTSGGDQTRDVTLDIYTSPEIWLDPLFMDVVVPLGGVNTQVLTVGNSGDEDLIFTLKDRETARTPLKGAGSGKSPVNEKVAKGDAIILDFPFEKPQASKLGAYDLLEIEGLDQYEREGKPIVPVRPVAVLVPYGKEVASVRVSAKDVYQLDGTYWLAPGQRPHPLSDAGPVVKTGPDAAVYGQKAPWPGMDYEEVATQSKRGYRLLTLNLFPVQYVPAAGTVSSAGLMRLEIQLSTAGQVDRNATLLRPSPATLDALRTLADNQSALATYPDDGPATPKDQPGALPAGGPYEHVIITTAALESAAGPYNFQALRDVRIAQGHTSTIVTTEWIYANYEGTRPDGGEDNQTRIRNFLIDAYATWGTEYVLLGGTHGLLPARHFYVQAFPGESDQMPVDMYYGCVDPVACTFDYDADGVYGEPTDGVGGGDVDLAAEIYVGRAAVDSEAEVANFVRKTLTYDASHGDYLPLVTMLGEYLGFGGVADYAKASMEEIRLGSSEHGYTTVGFENHTQPDFYDFDTSVNLYDMDATWSKNQLIALMNDGVHIFNHLGHSSQTYCAKLYTSDLPSLTNTEYFFFYSQGCLPGHFDTPNCFAEVITTMEQGAFAVIMNARYGWGTYNSTDGPSERFDRQFWDAVLDERFIELGRANQDSKEDNLWDINGSCIRWCYYELNLFGDPIQECEIIDDCEWITENPDGGTVVPSDSMPVDVTFTAGTMPAGLYEGEVLASSNDRDTPEVTVPVTMTILPDDLDLSPADGFSSS